MPKEDVARAIVIWLLSLAKEATRRIGVRLTLTPEPGVGTTVELAFRAPAGTSPPPPPGRPPPGVFGPLALRFPQPLGSSHTLMALTPGTQSSKISADR
ncbi:MAG: hypothetical protein KM312_06710 [Hydrogenibacillus schlegelii]|uniref:Uncharacterized protein n=1 Tax=Hydrogenibacillus schlegelii TaxID=1484 RepID=A0A947CWD9_HYDSH|nr:hypothetical protein [Hydrogenibacillus schlegelii]